MPFYQQNAHLGNSRQVDHCEVQHEGGVDAEVDALGGDALVVSRQSVGFANYFLADLQKIEKLLPRKV